MNYKPYVVMFFLIILLISVSSCVTGQRSEDVYKSVVEKDGMLFIPAGWFIMGSDKGLLNEKPAHDVYLDSYGIDKYEVSATEFAVFLNEKGNPDGKYFTHNKFSTVIGVSDIDGLLTETEENPEEFMPRQGYEDFPANNVSWFGADQYCLWKEKRLPTEAEWEKAARGIDGFIYPWGDSIPDETKARYNREWDESRFDVMVTVDSLPEGSSPFGALNMSGNVWEWINDWYRQNYCDFCSTVNSDIPPRNNPAGPPSGTFRVLRGGSWFEEDGVLRIKTPYRNWLEPDKRYLNTGYRCAKDDDRTDDE